MFTETGPWFCKKPCTVGFQGLLEILSVSPMSVSRGGGSFAYFSSIHFGMPVGVASMHVLYRKPYR